ncbi:MAG: lysophospholipid acyltransferase family protein [Methylomicrobium sp.]
MIAKFRQFYKIKLIVLLFLSGFVIVLAIFPALNRSYQPVVARDKINRIKLRWLKCFGRILNLQITIDGQAADESALIISNHISWLDIVAIGQHLPGYFVAKNDILEWPVIGYLSRQAGTVFIRRGDKQAIHETTERMSWLLKQNSKVFAFPEGTTSQGKDVLPFHSSLLQPALLTRSAIQPLALQYQGEAETLAPFVGDDAFIPHLLKLLALRKIEIRMKLLPVLEVADKSRPQLCKEAHERISNAIRTGSTAICRSSVSTPVSRKRSSVL